MLEIWEKSLNLSMELEAREPARVTIMVCDAAAPDLQVETPIMNVDQADILSKKPFRIFVENDEADRDFLLTFSNAEQKKKIEELEEAQLIQFEHCGGITELPKKVAKFTNKTELNHLIAMAVFDSDAPQPGEASTQADCALKKCVNCGIAASRLSRRAIENYLLRSWLNTWVNKTTARRERSLELYNTFCNLNDAQRAHFHMKNGLKVDKEKIADGTIDLYDNLSGELQRKLETGFGSVGSEIYSLSWIQNSQPSEDQNGWNEVNGIVNSFLVLCR